MKKETMQSITPEMVLQSVLELRKELKISSETTEKILAESTAETKKILAESETETRKIIAELSAAADKRDIEADKRTAEIDKRFAETEKLIKETNLMVNGIGKSNGAVAEETIYNALKYNMIYGGIEFDDILRNVKRDSKKQNLQGEFDAVLKNGDTLAIIETKYRVRKDDVNVLVNKKVEDFRKLFPKYRDYKILLGIGGMSFDEEAIKEANTNGVGIIKVVGEKVEFQTTDIKVY
jgi:hypothetical protein